MGGGPTAMFRISSSLRRPCIADVESPIDGRTRSRLKSTLLAIVKLASNSKLKLPTRSLTLCSVVYVCLVFMCVCMQHAAPCSTLSIHAVPPVWGVRGVCGEGAGEWMKCSVHVPLKSQWVFGST